MQLSPPKLEKKRGGKFDKRISDETSLGLPKKDVGKKKNRCVVFSRTVCDSMVLYLFFFGAAFLCTMYILCGRWGGYCEHIYMDIYSYLRAMDKYVRIFEGYG